RDVSGVDRPNDRDGCQAGSFRRDVRRARHLHVDRHRAADTVPSSGASFVTMVQAADFAECDHVTLGDALHASGSWRVFRQREMCSRSVIVRYIIGQDSAQMPLAEYDHVVQAVAPDGSNQPLRIWVLPWTGR